MLILPWIGFIFVFILYVAIARYKILTNMNRTHVKISIKHGSSILFLNHRDISLAFEYPTYKLEKSIPHAFILCNIVPRVSMSVLVGQLSHP
jgi:multisubunit Na+/H+ antiporter MnhC subunit